MIATPVIKVDREGSFPINYNKRQFNYFFFFFFIFFFQEKKKLFTCVENINIFSSCLLLSVETQHTIGYGGRSTNEECPEAIFVMCIQSVTGVMISAFMAGVFFAKMARPKQRRQTLLFSRKAIICQRDGQLCLMFRVGDMRKSHIIGVAIRAHLFRTRTTREGKITQSKIVKNK